MRLQQQQQQQQNLLSFYVHSNNIINTNIFKGNKSREMLLSPPSSSTSSSGCKDQTRGLMGFGFLVRGFRCVPWMAVIFFLKDGLNVDHSTLQLLLSSANLPMAAKPLYGVVSDTVYIYGQHRLPYISIGVFLQAVSWLAIAILSPSTSSISIFTIGLYLLLSCLGASIADVASEAIVAEVGKQDPTFSRKPQLSSSGELQSFVWIASSAGGVLGNLLGGIAIHKFSPQAIFLFFSLILALQFFVMITVHESSLNLARSSSNAGIRKQISDLSVALRKPEIAYSIMWLVASYAIIPTLTGTMFFYQTQYLKINSLVLGISKVFGQAAMLLWCVIYHNHLKLVPARKVIAAIQAMISVFMVSDVLFVKGIYRKMGVADSFYVIVFSGILEVLLYFKLLPFNVLIGQLCPSGCEGSLMAFVASAISLAFVLSGYLGAVLVSYVDVTGNDFSGFPHGLLIQAVCTILPLCCTSCIADDEKSETSKKSE